MREQAKCFRTASAVNERRVSIPQTRPGRRATGFDQRHSFTFGDIKSWVEADNEVMSVPEILRNIGERFEASATVRNVYGEPISIGNRTVIPVARISYGFGGGGRGGGPQDDRQGSGGGGGGHISAVPVGVVEITPEGTRFTPFTDWRKLGLIVAISLAVGFVFGRRG